MPPAAGQHDAFRIVSAPGEIIHADYRLTEDWSVAVEQGRSERRDFLAFRMADATRYAAALINYERGDLSASATVGLMTEPRGPLGSDVANGTAFRLPAQTSFGAASLTLRPLARLTLRGEVAFGRTEIEQAFLQTNGSMSSQWSLGAYGECGLFALPCDRFSLELEQPLRIEQGSFEASLADIPTDWRLPTTFSTRRFSASPSGRQIDLRMRFDRDLGDWGLLRLRTAIAFEHGHHAGAGLAAGAALDWRLTF